MLFENTTLITKEKILQWAKFSYYKINKKNFLRNIIMSSTLIAISIIWSILEISPDNFNSQSATLSTLSVSIGIALFILSVFPPKFRIIPNQEILQPYHFSEDYFEIITTIETRKIQYSSTFSCYDDKNNIYLVQSNKKTAYIISKDSFTVGNANDFITFIKNKIN